jgi:hypothetical protein
MHRQFRKKGYNTPKIDVETSFHRFSITNCMGYGRDGMSIKSGSFINVHTFMTSKYVKK